MGYKDRTYKCLYCQKNITVGKYGHLRPHKKGTRGCVGSGQSVHRMSRDEEFLDMTKKLGGGGRNGQAQEETAHDEPDHGIQPLVRRYQ